jgi:hypothetical protein
VRRTAHRHRRGVDGDVTAEARRLLARDREAKASAVPGVGCAPSGERLEDPLTVRLGDSRTGIVHMDDHVAALLLEHHG